MSVSLSCNLVTFQAAFVKYSSYICWVFFSLLFFALVIAFLTVIPPFFAPVSAAAFLLTMTA